MGRPDSMFPDETLAVTSAAGDAYRPSDRGKHRNRHQLLTPGTAGRRGYRGGPSVKPILQLKGVGKTYRRGDERVDVLVDFEFTLDAGEFVVVTGPSGAGKSTLLHIAGGLDAPDIGTVAVAGQDVWAMSAGARAAFRRRNLGFVFQFFNLVPMLTAVENVSLPLLLDGMPARSADARAEELLERVGLGDRARRRPAELLGRTDATGGGGARAGSPAVHHPRR